MKKTVLNQLHKDLGAKMTDFGGWEMPVEYEGIITEHKSVRKNCGLFDVSHMGEILIKGKNAGKSVQKIITNNLDKLNDGQILYTPICQPDGGIIDDLLVYRLSLEKYLLVVNASNIEKDFSWVENHLLADTIVENMSDQYAMLALQGPASRSILTKLITADLETLAYYSFINEKILKNKVIISRTGYTGELGYELYFEPAAARTIWQEIMAAGEEYDLKPCGLGARDTLRLEKLYALYGNDIDEQTNPFTANLAWTVDLEKDDFIGKQALIEIKKNGFQQKLTAFKIIGRGIARSGDKVYIKNQKIGQVTSGSYSPILKQGIGMAYLDNEYTKIGAEIEIKVRNRKLKAKVVKGPFV
ncbi:glycine cleavage system aminomethyltransferase GcvT [Halanaerobium salsuginis]|uniref:Aminomethyltransferase n=1 Tax=Halanaerobium salsuginis TaxID=29563 RepID=A0A1I4LAX8_9FIRM|nr:glycine cleavage system aminomethyltransferase GcvT [Halanaerobium salsuginis]SFL88152.1 aminomethyltransferase [Halanaerobium salsuginis]